MASTRTCLPAAKDVPSTLVTLMASFDSSTWYVPEVPSAQLVLIVLGWFGSGPLPSRPLSSVPESQRLPTAPHFGALRVAS